MEPVLHRTVQEQSKPFGQPHVYQCAFSVARSPTSEKSVQSRVSVLFHLYFFCADL